ncbi:hypothetical protein [Phytohabitans rumicis]|uniref:Uncharacterized protein n=1 Tax=Phytohabitans rumicis TaxID=1076125 RepID=A0A6V8L6F3_9ACTN|nr:hypothetical protein [Phytohabitans rumicis]GFJ92813.1 hypothetical protein Prum_064550 [Phytohabitans rumicis]
MIGLLGEVGKGLAGRLSAAVALPGLLFLGAVYLAAGVAGWHPGDGLSGVFGAHGSALDLGAFVAWSGAHLKSLQDAGTAAIAVTAVAVFLLALAAALAAQLVGWAIQRMWLGSLPFAGALTRRRADRWRAADERLDEPARQIRAGEQPDEARIAELSARRNEIALHPPRAATWMGDRLLAVESRVHVTYGLDLASAWPRLWLVASDAARAEFGLARDAFDRAARLGGWGILYGLLGLAWYPALLIGVATELVAWRTARLGADRLAEATEAIVDLHVHDLAEQVHVSPPAGVFDPETGRTITRLLRKGA